MMTMSIGIAADHGGYALKTILKDLLIEDRYDIIDYGAYQVDSADDYPDFVIPMSKALSEGSITHGIAICGSGVGACIAANKVTGVRAALISDSYSARQGVEDDDMNMICLGGQVIGPALAWEIVQHFLAARFKNEPRFNRRLQKLKGLEIEWNKADSGEAE